MRRYCTSVFAAPDLTQDHVVRQHLAGMRDEQPQQIVLPGREFNLVAAHRHDASYQIDREVTGAEQRLLALLLQLVSLRGADRAPTVPRCRRALSHSHRRRDRAP